MYANAKRSKRPLTIERVVGVVETVLGRSVDQVLGSPNVVAGLPMRWPAVVPFIGVVLGAPDGMAEVLGDFFSRARIADWSMALNCRAAEFVGRTPLRGPSWWFPRCSRS